MLHYELTQNMGLETNRYIQANVKKPMIFNGS